MLEIITEAADIHCPVRKMKFRENSPEWITKDMISEISLKDYLYKKAKNLDTPESWEIFQRKKNEVKKLLATAKENFIQDKLEELEPNPRKFWRTINNMSGLGKNKGSNKGCTKIIDEDGEVYENLDASEYLNSYYVNVRPNLARENNMTWDVNKCNIQIEDIFQFDWVTEKEVLSLVKYICITKSAAVEGLSTRILKDAFLVMIFELTYLYNACLQHGVFPEIWGISMVTPIPKTNIKSTKPGDWRPISQISLPGKILERIIHTQLYSYLDKNNVLSLHQYGFRKGLSTILAIFDVLKELYGNWNGKMYSGCVFVDFSRAFDKNHKPPNPIPKTRTLWSKSYCHNFF